MKRKKRKEKTGKKNKKPQTTQQFHFHYLHPFVKHSCEEDMFSFQSVFGRPQQNCAYKLSWCLLCLLPTQREMMVRKNRADWRDNAAGKQRDQQQGCGLRHLWKRPVLTVLSGQWHLWKRSVLTTAFNCSLLETLRAELYEKQKVRFAFFCRFFSLSLLW